MQGKLHEPFTFPTMRRAIIKFLCFTSLLFCLFVITGCVVVICITRQLITQSQVNALEITMRTHADALASIREEINVTGSQIPVYAVTLKKSSQIFQDALRAADDLEKLTDIAIKLPIVGTMQPFDAMKEIAHDLRDFLPQFSRSLAAAEKSLAGYTPENHEKLIASIDQAALMLRTNADQLEQQIGFLRQCIYGFLAVCIMAAIAHAGLAIAILLVLAPMDPSAAPRRRVSFM